MGRIRVQPRMPEHRDGKSDGLKREHETVHPRAQFPGVTLRDGRDEVGVLGQRERARNPSTTLTTARSRSSGSSATSSSPRSESRPDALMCWPAK